MVDIVKPTKADNLKALIQSIVTFNLDHAGDTVPKQLTVQQNPGDAALVQYSIDGGVSWFDTPSTLVLAMYPDQTAARGVQTTAIAEAEAAIRLLNIAEGLDS